VKRLRDEFNMVSAYHSFFQEQQGDETRPTHVHNTRKTTFHIDYIFVPTTWVKRMVRVDLGRREEWGQYSDHLPLVAEFDAELSRGSDRLPMLPDHASSRPPPARQLGAVQLLTNPGPSPSKRSCATSLLEGT
jgi:hypothetical protein